MRIEMDSTEEGKCKRVLLRDPNWVFTGVGGPCGVLSAFKPGDIINKSVSMHVLCEKRFPVRIEVETTEKLGHSIHARRGGEL